MNNSYSRYYEDVCSRYYEDARMMASEEQRTRDRKVKIAAMPRVKFRCGRDWYENRYVIGIYWDKKINADEGELIYQKWIAFRWSASFDVSTK